MTVKIDKYRHLYVLDTDKYDTFINALDNAPTAGSNLRALMKHKPLWEAA